MLNGSNSHNGGDIIYLKKYKFYIIEYLLNTFSNGKEAELSIKNQCAIPYNGYTY